MNLSETITNLRNHPSIASKLSINKTASMLSLTQESEGMPGDDAAILPRGNGDGYDLLAGEGFITAFVKDDPWFAGWCGLMVNISDIAAMGGKPVGVIDQIWAPDAETAAPLMQGMKDASDAYSVPILGGHSNLSASDLNLAVSVFGRANALITSFDAKAGDILIAAIDHRGNYRNFDNFFAADDAPHHRLKGDLELLPKLAEQRLVIAGKDISQGGIAGTALMLAECSDVGIRIDLDALTPPQDISKERWLRSFPSFGFLLTVSEENAEAVCDLFHTRDITAQVIGDIIDGSSVSFHTQGQTEEFWNYKNQPYLGLGRKELCHA
ncbi:MAG: sll0787 family AIR synthase-like protein [Cohaesibacter sp.]|nr:sll0787 family AIR synthase-like protein [Cohaesibacter sp.]MCV6602839.1 sll0787 family AIR synthase-like protein [Cohaesibacter sp.]